MSERRLNRATLMKALHILGNSWQNIKDGSDRGRVVQIQGKTSTISIMDSTVCAEAARALEEAPLEALKFRRLVEGMRKTGMGHLYQHIMGEELPDERY